MDRIDGFILNPNVPFIIDKSTSSITYQGVVHKLRPEDMVQTETNLYLRSSFFGEIFGLECVFNFRNLSVNLTPRVDLPIMREMQQQLMYKNLSRLKGEKKADTVLTRSFSLFKLGMADWQVTSTQQTNAPTTVRANVNLGLMLAGGETNFNLNYNSGEPFSLKKQFYSWRYVNNKNLFVRQVTVGKVFAQATSSLFAPVNGIQISNTPTTYRRSFGSYRLSNHTEPGWMVELYINNVLVNYMKADASGFYAFDIPMVYGTSIVKLRFYGPWGEEQISEQYINVPFNFIPNGQFEYNVTAGIVEDGSKSKFAKANFKYGLSPHITIGGGAEYLTGANKGQVMPFINASIRLNSRLMVTAERMYGVRTTGMLSYKTHSRMQVDFNYTKYDKLQTAVKYNYQEEKKLVFTMPFRRNKYAGFTRLTVNQLTQLKSKITTSELVLSAMRGPVSANFTTTAIITQKKPLVVSNLSVYYNVNNKLKFNAQALYDYRIGKLSSVRAEAEKSVTSKGFMNVSYQKDLVTGLGSINAGLRLNLSFVQAFMTGSYANNVTTTVQTLRSSLAYDDNSNHLQMSNQSNVGRGGLLIAPFLDMNGNDEWDVDEPEVEGLKLRVNGGRQQYNKKDGSISITGMEAYNSYFVEIDKNSFDNVAWQIKKPTIQVEIDPNQFRRIEVPVAVMGEVSGFVLLSQNNATKGLGRMIVEIFNEKNNKPVARFLTESDGFFSFIGLVPGKYRAVLNTEQLTNLNMQAEKNSLKFTIKKSKDGDIVDGLEFTITKNDFSKK